MLKYCPKCWPQAPQTMSTCPRDGQALVMVPVCVAELPKLAPGSLFEGRYEILALLCSGATGSIYRAQHKILANSVALKLIHPERLSKERFRLEVQAASLLRHPNIAAIYDFGISMEGSRFTVMELLNGPSLAATIRKDGALRSERFLHVFRQVCDALSLAHEHGVIHRSLKPENIILTSRDDEKDIVKIVDFGMETLPAQVTRDSAGLMHSRVFFGTQQYMSPEQHMRGAVDVRSDIYSLGLIMYEALTGSWPFADSTADQQMSHAPAFRADLHVAENLQAAVMKCLERDPARRYQSINELRQELDTIRASQKSAFSFFGRKQNVHPVFKCVVVSTLAMAVVLGIRLAGQHGQSIAATNQVTNQAVSTTAPSQTISSADTLKRGIELSNQGDLTQAISWFDKSINLDRTLKQAWLCRAEAYSSLGQYDKAIDDYTQILTMEPDSSSAHLARGNAFLHANQLENAIADIKEAIKLEPENAKLYLDLAEAYSSASNYRQALATYSRAIALGLGDSATYCNRARQYLHLKRYHESRVDFDTAIRLDPQNASAYAGRGRVYDTVSRYEKALPDYDKAIKLDNSNTEVLMLRDQCLKKTNVRKKAIASGNPR